MLMYFVLSCVLCSRLIESLIVSFSFMKSVVGKDLTKVTMPVHFNEPLSFLQVRIFYTGVWVHTLYI